MMSDSLKFYGQISFFPYPVLFRELVRIEKITIEKVGQELSFSDGDAGGVFWNLKGLRAGLFSVQFVPGNRPAISLRFNPSIIAKVGEEAFKPTVAHEYAHAIVHRIRIQSRGRKLKEDIRPHGKLWQSLMILYGYSPQRCHDYPVTPAQTRKVFHYRCTGCHHEYYLGGIRHQRLLKNPGYLVCGRCRNGLHFEKEHS